MKAAVVLMDILCSHCGHFYCYNDSEVNNGYNCNHPKQQEVEEADNGVEVGCCHTYSCPLGHNPYNRELVKWKILTEDDISSEAMEYSNNDYVVVTEESLVKYLIGSGYASAVEI